MEILATTTVMVGIPIVALIWIGLLVGIFLGTFSALASDEPILGLMMGIICVVIFVFIPVMSGASPTYEETHYKVTLDESVNFVEFNEKYEVIDQEGEIYTIRERIE